MQSTGAATAAAATGAASAMPATANVTFTSHPGDPSSYRPEFRALDTDQDGLLSRAEARSNPKLQQQFSAMDTNHDGKLSRTETENVIN
jgi:Ca2+-binding EF-hand superfamily protein